MGGKFLIYALSDPRTDEVRYVGKSCSGLARPRQHLQAKTLREDPTYKAKWLRSLIAAGHAPEVLVIHEAESREALPDAERWWIAYGRAMCWPLTNLTEGGDGVVGADPSVIERIANARRGRKQSPATVAKRAASMRAYYATHEHPSRGSKHSDEHRAKIAAANRGRVKTPEECARISAAKMGHTVTAATRAKISTAHMGREFSAEHRAKLSASRMGNKNARRKPADG